MAKDKVADFVSKHTFTADQLIVEEKPKLVLAPRLQELTGGIRLGSSIILSGKEGCGKTTTALHIAAMAQNQFEMPTYYINSECRLGLRDFQGCFQFKPDQDYFKVIQPQEDEVLYAEDYLGAVEHIVRTHSKVCVVVDSLSTMTAKDLVEDGDMTRRYMSRMPAILSQFQTILSSMLRKDIIVIFICHEMTNISPMSRKTWNIKGGNAIKFGANYIIRCTHNKDWLDGEENIGQINHWTILKSATSTKNATVASKFRYGYGIDEVAEIMEMGVEFGILIKKGGGNWYYNDNHFARGEPKAIEYLNENPEIYGEIKKKVLDILEM